MRLRHLTRKAFPPAVRDVHSADHADHPADKDGYEFGHAGELPGLDRGLELRVERLTGGDQPVSGH
jgi:hypothetical protein